MSSTPSQPGQGNLRWFRRLTVVILFINIVQIGFLSVNRNDSPASVRYPEIREIVESSPVLKSDDYLRRRVSLILQVYREYMVIITTSILASILSAILGVVNLRLLSVNQN